jgi:hypothetical protein
MKSNKVALLLVALLIPTAIGSAFAEMKDTDAGRFSVQFIGSPPIVEAGTTAKFYITFFDKQTQLVEKNIVYDFAVVIDDRKIVDKKQVQALSGDVIEEVAFPGDEPGIYTVRLDNIHYVTEPPDPTGDDIAFSVAVIRPDVGEGEGIPPMTQTTMGGRFDVEIVFSPSVIEPNKVQKFALSFFNTENGFVERNVQYDFAIVKDGTDLVNKKGQSAPDGTAVQEFTFSEEQTGSVTVRIDNVRVFGEPVISADETAFSVNVVPEFPIGIMLIAASAVAGTILFGRFKKLPHL